MKTYTLAEMEDMCVGKIGTKERDEYENEFRLELLARTVKNSRKEQQLTQQALGELAGVSKSQITKIENQPNNASLETFYKVLRALKKNFHFNIQIDNQQIQLA